MSTLTKYSAIPYTGPAPTNREPFVPKDGAAMDARGAELAGTLPGVEHEAGQDLPTLIVPRDWMSCSASAAFAVVVPSPTTRQSPTRMAATFLNPFMIRFSY